MERVRGWVIPDGEESSLEDTIGGDESGVEVKLPLGNLMLYQVPPLGNLGCIS